MILSSIAAMSRNRVIGKKNRLPWHLPDDLIYFRDKTAGRVLIMGRKTFDSINKPLPGRFHIIVTRNPNFRYDHPQVSVVHDISSAIDKAKTLTELYGNEVFVVGGSQIYAETMNLVDRLYLTVIDQDFEGDSYFPPYDEKAFREVESDHRPGPIPFTFKVYERSNKPYLTRA